MKNKKPTFSRQGEKNLKRLGRKWRRPKGMHSKLRRHKKAKGFMPQPGYGSPKAFRYLHPSGFEEVIVFNIKDLENINPTKQACRIASVVGKKKKVEIMKKTEELKIKVLNPFKVETQKVEKV